MQIYTHTLPGGAQLIGYLRDRTVEMPAFNTRPAILILPGGGYAWCSKREADPVAMQFLQAGYNVFTLYYTCRSDETVPALRWQPLIDALKKIDAEKMMDSRWGERLKAVSTPEELYEMIF